MFSFFLFYLFIIIIIIIFYRNLHLVSGIVKSALKASVLTDFSKLTEKKNILNTWDSWKAQKNRRPVTKH